MTTQPNQPLPLAPAIASLLVRLRKRIRAYVWAEGITVALLLLGISFWASLAFDWVFEPPVPLRMALLIALGLVFVYVIFRYILRRAFVRLANRNLALLLERRFQGFRDSLLTTVEISEQGVPDDVSREMFAHTQQEALAGTKDVALIKVFNSGRLSRRVALGTLLLASVVVFGLTATAAFGIWARRSLLLSEEIWPRKTHLVVEGFENGQIKIARGGDLSLVVKADAGPGREVPETVEVRMMTADRRREKMNREGVAVPGEGEFQNYSYKFKSVLDDMDFHLVGGDDRQGPFHLHVVESPTINEMILHCLYPAYMNRTSRDIPVTGVMNLPVGTEITIRARANKELAQVQIDDQVGESAPVTNRLELAGSENRGRRDFAFPLPALQLDKILLFTLVDTDGIRSRDPVRLSLGAVPDDPPHVAVQLKGIGSAITPQARLPMLGEISDDYGISRAWFDFHVNDAPPQQRPLAAEIRGEDKLAVSEALEVRELNLEPKQKLHLAIQAADNDALAAAPHVGASQRYVLDVVTPEKLRSMLESRELMLRRRFEVMIQELTDTRDLIVRIDFKQPAAAGGKPPGAAVANAPAGAASADAAGENRSPERLLALRRVQAERVLQNSERSAHETMALAISFDDIREELINNRVDTEELKSRLKDGIAEPLKRIVDQRFPRLEERLKKLAASLADAPAGTIAQASARDEADAILVEMKQVLDKMLELETFNEALDLLREIISAQEKVQQETKQKSKSF